jgi:hypothetical protein
MTDDNDFLEKETEQAQGPTDFEKSFGPDVSLASLPQMGFDRISSQEFEGSKVIYPPLAGVPTVELIWARVRLLLRKSWKTVGFWYGLVILLELVLSLVGVWMTYDRLAVDAVMAADEISRSSRHWYHVYMVELNLTNMGWMEVLGKVRGIGGFFGLLSILKLWFVFGLIAPLYVILVESPDAVRTISDALTLSLRRWPRVLMLSLALSLLNHICCIFEVDSFFLFGSLMLPYILVTQNIGLAEALMRSWDWMTAHFEATVAVAGMALVYTTVQVGFFEFAKFLLPPNAGFGNIAFLFVLLGPWKLIAGYFVLVVSIATFASIDAHEDAMDEIV